jgi:hypothetical protein
MQTYREFRDFVIALIGVMILFVTVAVAATLVPVKTSGRYALTALTPLVIGNAAGRVYLYIKNDDTTNPVYCGYTPASLSNTPGPNSGAQFDAFRARSDFVWPDKVISCLAIASGVIVSYDEARMITATATATAIATPTPT